MTLLWRFLPEQLVPHSLEASGSADIWTTLPRRFLPEQLVPHSLEVSGSVQTSGRHCSRDSFRSNWSHTPWRCLGVSRRPDDIALEIPSGGTGPTLLGGVWECPDIWMTLLWRFLPEQLVPHSLEVSGSVQMSGRHCSRDSVWGNWSHTPWRCLGVCYDFRHGLCLIYLSLTSLLIIYASLSFLKYDIITTSLQCHSHLDSTIAVLG